MMIFLLVVMIGLEKCCITSACLQWLCHSGERTVARGPLVSLIIIIIIFILIYFLFIYLFIYYVFLFVCLFLAHLSKSSG